MVAGQRFDLDEAREQARRAKEQAKMKALISNIVLVVVLIVVVLGCWFGWTKWQEKKERDREAAEEAERVENERMLRERKKQEAERKAREEKRLREKREREAERKRQQQEREAERQRQQIERERQRFEKEEARRLEKENQQLQKELKEYASSVCKGVKFDIDSHLVIEHDTEHMVDFTVEESRWDELASSLLTPIDFFTLLKNSPDNPVEADFSEMNYPSMKLIGQLLDNLKKEKFTIVATLTPDAVKSGGYVLVATDPENGLVTPKECVETKDAKDKKKVIAWNVPFTYGENETFYFMSQKTANIYIRDWKSCVKRIRKEANSKPKDPDYFQKKIDELFPEFVTTVKTQITTPPPEPEKPAVVEQSQQERKPKATLKGGSLTNSGKGGKGLTNMRSFATPAQQRR